jgi:hypothetical protein
LIGGKFVPYALFDRDRQIGQNLPSEVEVWQQALDSRLISDAPVAGETGGRALYAIYHVKEIREEHCTPDSAWNLPDEIS